MCGAVAHMSNILEWYSVSTLYDPLHCGCILHSSVLNQRLIMKVFNNNDIMNKIANRSVYHRSSPPVVKLRCPPLHSVCTTTTTLLTLRGDKQAASSARKRTKRTCCFTASEKFGGCCRSNVRMPLERRLCDIDRFCRT